MTMEIKAVSDLVEDADKRGCALSEVVLARQAQALESTEEALFVRMASQLDVMEKSIEMGMDKNLKSVSGLSGGDAWRLKTASEEGRIPSDIIHKAMTAAVAAAEYNACMGRIVAAPTAGSCGILPGVLKSAMDEYGIPRYKIVKSLFTAAGIGLVIARNASISGAEGGCQAECGAAAAMAAAAFVELRGGTPQMASHAAALALENVMGLVCDPVAGLVEVPCVYRNASGAANAIASANMALAGLKSVIPCDEVIFAMNQVGRAMPSSLKETAEGGIAATPTGKSLNAE